MIFSYNWLQDYIKPGVAKAVAGKGKLPHPERLAELLALHIFEVEEVCPVRSPFREGRRPRRFTSNGVKSKDWILDIDVLPNRAPDCFSHLGIARECAAFLNLKFQNPNFKLIEDKTLKAKDFVLVEVKDKEACPRYSARVICDVKVGASPKWLKERLEVCGLQSINNIVDIANYVMLETGQPLHAFDLEKLEGKKLIVRFAKNGEEITTLDEQRFKLDKDILVIADEKKPVAIAGIKGGKGPGIGKNTKTVVLESANFNQVVIRNGSRKLSLRTDASIRFEHGIDPNLTEKAINRTASLIQEISGGKIAKGLVDFFPKKVLPKKIKLELDYVEKLLGVKISKKEMKKILNSLDLKVHDTSCRQIEVEVPTRRLDISIPEDLIEEIGRIHGYDKIEPVFPIVALAPPERNLQLFWEHCTKNNLKENGFTEVYNYSFISEMDAEIFNYGASKKEMLFELENPMSKEQKYLRPTLIINLLKNVKTNEKNFEDINIFELGKIFTKGGKKNASNEKKMLAGLMLLNTFNRSTEIAPQFYQLKGVIDVLLASFGISGVWYDSYQASPEDSQESLWHPKRSAEIKVGNEEIGFLGEISPKILKEYKISKRVVAFDIDFEKLIILCSEECEFEPICSFPAAIRDLAVLVPKPVRVEQVLNIIESAGGALVRDVDLFDIYEGEELPEEKKNLAFHIVYQAKDRTLKSKEIDEIQQKIVKALEENPDWEVRR